MQIRYTLKPVQILLVLHSEEDAAGIKYALDKLELYYELSWARDAGEALSVLKERTIRKLIPDLVLVDEELPGNNGRMLVRDIRKEKSWKQFPCFLLVTPEKPIATEPPEMEELSGYINKPFSINGLAKSGSLNLVMDLINSSNYRKR
jgi:CheY-like chemotaxis protein